MRFAPPLLAQTDAARVWGRRVRPLPVGLVAWPPEDERTTVVVKASFDLGATLLLSDRQRPFGRGNPATREGSLDIERADVDDLVIAKLGADVLFAGSAHGASPSERIPCRIRVGEAFELAFAAVAASSLEQIPLTGAHLRTADGRAPLPPVGPIRAREVEAAPPSSLEPLDDELRAEVLAAIRADLDSLEAMRPPEDASSSAEGTRARKGSWEGLAEASRLGQFGVQHAAAQLVVPHLRGDELLELDGLSPGGGRRTLTLPGLEPLVIAEGRRGRHRVILSCDTLVLDDAGLTLTWRGEVPEDLLASPVARLVVTLAPRDRWPSVAEIEAELVRAHFTRVEVADGAGALAAPSPDVELELARVMHANARPRPLLATREFGEVRDALDATDDRASTLARFGLDEELWSIELLAQARPQMEKKE